MNLAEAEATEISASQEAQRLARQVDSLLSAANAAYATQATFDDGMQVEEMYRGVRAARFALRRAWSDHRRAEKITDAAML